MARTPIPAGAPLPLPPSSPFISAVVVVGYYTSPKGQRHRLARGICRTCGAERMAIGFYFRRGLVACEACARVRKAEREAVKAERAAERETERAARVASVVDSFPASVVREARELYGRGVSVETMAGMYWVNAKALRVVVTGKI